jgi:AcrR family transcriptional regulator
MAERVKRSYTSPRRAELAARTRAEVLAAAHELFLERGYAAAGVTEIARRAGVNVDTVYSSVGRKPQLMLGVIDRTLGSSDQPLPALERDYVKAVQAAPTAALKLRTYAEALGRLMPRVSPLFTALREAALADPECANLDERIARRRASNMRLLAADLRATGELRSDLDDDDVAELIWATNAPDWYTLVTSHGWTAERYVRTLGDVWCRTLLAAPDQDGQL